VSRSAVIRMMVLSACIRNSQAQAAILRHPSPTQPVLPWVGTLARSVHLGLQKRWTKQTTRLRR
jgi:hypothetical protein